MSFGKFLNRPDSNEQACADPQVLIEEAYRYVGALEGRTQLQSTPRYLRLVVKSIEQAIHAKENGNFYAMHSTRFPVELFWPLGIMPLFDEVCSTVIGLIGNDDPPFLSIADRCGFPRYDCSCDRMFLRMAEAGAWPVPDIVVYDSSPCDPASKGHAMAASYLGVPSFGLDRPYRLFTAQGMDYWTGEHQALVRFLEQQTGRAMDYDYLKEVTRLSFRAAQICVEINELRGTVPCPLPAEASFAPMAVYGAWAGTQTCVDFLEQLRDELQERVAQGIGAVANEKFRCACASSEPFFDFGIMAESEKRYGAVNVMDRLQWWREDADWLIDPDDPVASLACRVQYGTANAMYGTAACHAEEMRQAALKCRADGVVYFSNLRCPHDAGGHRVLRDTIERSLGLPWVRIDCGMLGKSATSFEDVMTQLDVFFRTVESGRSYHERIRQRGSRSRETRVTA
jgi:benzoyl-CoA reductase/2-hydroxyglutaryl-CoA dehydratase subunit BcrC/BadD/HgdB